MRAQLPPRRDASQERLNLLLQLCAREPGVAAGAAQDSRLRAFIDMKPTHSTESTRNKPRRA